MFVKKSVSETETVPSNGDISKDLEESPTSAKSDEACDRSSDSPSLCGFQVVDEADDDSSCHSSGNEDLCSDIEQAEGKDSYVLDESEQEKLEKPEQIPVAKPDPPLDEIVSCMDQDSNIEEKKVDEKAASNNPDIELQDSEEQKDDSGMEDVDQDNELGPKTQEDIASLPEVNNEDDLIKKDYLQDNGTESGKIEDGSEKLFASSGESEDSAMEENEVNPEEEFGSKETCESPSSVDDNQLKIDQTCSVGTNEHSTPIDSTEHAEHSSVQEVEVSTPVVPSSHVSLKKSDGCVRSIRKKYAKSAANKHQSLVVRPRGRPRKIQHRSDTVDGTRISSIDSTRDEVSPSEKTDTYNLSEQEVAKDQDFESSAMAEEKQVVKEERDENDSLGKNTDESQRLSKRKAKKKEFTDHVSFDLKRSSQRSDKPSTDSGLSSDEKSILNPSVNTSLSQSLQATPVKVKREGEKKNAEPAVLATPSPFRGRKSKTTFDKEKVAIPFSKGWMREIVHRATFDKTKGNKAIDIYYFTPEGNKLRSMPDVSKYLADHKGLGLTIENFTFAREKIYREPFEKERGARPRVGDGVEESPVQSVKEETQTTKKESRKSLPVSSKKNKEGPKTINETSSCDKDTSDKLPQRSARKLKRTYSELDKGEDISEDSDSFVKTPSRHSLSKDSSKSAVKDNSNTSVTGKNKVSSETSEIQKTVVSSTPSREKRNRLLSSKSKHSVDLPQEGTLQKKKKTAHDNTSSPSKNSSTSPAVSTSSRTYGKRKYTKEKSSKQGS